MRFIIIGGSGFIGSNLFSFLRKKQQNVVATYLKKKIYNMIRFDLTRDKISNIISDLNANDVVIILSGINSPNTVFDNKNIAYQTNVVSTIELIKDLNEKKCKILFMSSTSVFDGTTDFYVESTKTNPLNTYGKYKQTVEEYLKKNCKNFLIIRTGWIVGNDKKNMCVVKLTYDTLLSKNAKMAEDNTFCITHIEDIVSSIYKLMLNSIRNICHISSSQVIQRVELADFIMKHSKKGALMNYKKVPFSSIKYSEPRGKLNHLKSEVSFVNDNLSFRSPYETIIQKVNILDNF